MGTYSVDVFVADRGVATYDIATPIVDKRRPLLAMIWLQLTVIVGQVTQAPQVMIHTLIRLLLSYL